VEKFHQPRRIRAHAIPDKAAPGVATQFLQLQLAARVSLREILWILQVLQDAVGAPQPAMIGAFETVHNAGRIPHQPLPTMAAGVVEGLDGAIVLPHADDAFMQEIMDDEVAWLLQFVDAAGDVPDALPHMLPLTVGEVLGPVAVTRDRIAAQMGRVAPVQRQRMQYRQCHPSSSIAIGRCGPTGIGLIVRGIWHWRQLA